MNYNETLEYLYSLLPMFQRDGKTAFKKDLTNTRLLLQFLDNPERKFKSIHIAGTNGKGTVAHMLSAGLQTSRYKVGLYTSPHLEDFRERIRIDGKMVSQEFVQSFVRDMKAHIEEIKPSFFELTVAMAFFAFAQEKVDVAVVETGMGGRLDSTNVLSPLLSIITNVSMDHQMYLGDTLDKIANEKAGIIKQNTPIIYGGKPGIVEDVIINKARIENAPYFAAYKNKILPSQLQGFSDEQPNFVIENLYTVDACMPLLKKSFDTLNSELFYAGITNFREITGQRGRWETLKKSPKVIVDCGHNEDGWNEILMELSKMDFKRLTMILGFVNDKDLDPILSKLPDNCHLIFTEPRIPRALSIDEIEKYTVGLPQTKEFIKDIDQAYQRGLNVTGDEDVLFIGGSIFIVAEVLKYGRN